jgi:hypothetical protein
MKPESYRILAVYVKVRIGGSKLRSGGTAVPGWTSVDCAHHFVVEPSATFPR